MHATTVRHQEVLQTVQMVLNRVTFLTFSKMQPSKQSTCVCQVVLLEQQQVTAGTTWHAAGLMVTFGSMNETSTDMRKYTRKLYSELEAETGQATGFKPVGTSFLSRLIMGTKVQF